MSDITIELTPKKIIMLVVCLSMWTGVCFAIGLLAGMLTEKMFPPMNIIINHYQNDFGGKDLRKFDYEKK